MRPLGALDGRAAVELPFEDNVASLAPQQVAQAPSAAGWGSSAPHRSFATWGRRARLRCGHPRGRTRLILKGAAGPYPRHGFGVGRRPSLLITGKRRARLPLAVVV